LKKKGGSRRSISFAGGAPERATVPNSKSVMNRGTQEKTNTGTGKKGLQEKKKPDMGLVRKQREVGPDDPYLLEDYLREGGESDPNETE